MRFRGKEVGCLGCLRITVGTEEEVDRLLHGMALVLEDLLQSQGESAISAEAKAKKNEANDIVS